MNAGIVPAPVTNKTRANSGVSMESKSVTLRTDRVIMGDDLYMDAHLIGDRRMNFGEAIEALKKGSRVARQGWNGKGMYLALQAGSVITREQARGGVAKCLAESGQETITICPHIDMKAADGTCVVGWLASQTDMLSEDWVIVE